MGYLSQVTKRVGVSKVAQGTGLWGMGDRGSMADVDMEGGYMANGNCISQRVVISGLQAYIKKLVFL